MLRRFVVGDLHLRKEQPFLGAAHVVLDSILDNTSSEDHVIFLGDFFHSSRPYPEELRVANSFFTDFKGTITILAGNHEYLQTRDSFVEDIFRDNPVEFIDTPTEVSYTDEDYLFLPWISSLRLHKEGFETLKDYYASWLQNWEPASGVNSDRPLYVLFHFEDETVFTGLEDLGVDLSVIQTKVGNRKVTRIGGHIHNPSDSYLGTPYATRKDESIDRDFCILEKDETDSEFHKKYLPNTVRYLDVDYEDLKTTEFEDGCSYVLSVYGVPSSEVLFSWKAKYPTVYIEDYTLKFGSERILSEGQEEKLTSIREYLESFIRQNRVDSDTANYLLSIF